MKIFLPLHCDSGNRGCEAITRSTAKLLNLLPQNCIALTRNYDLDASMGLSEYVNLKQGQNKLDLFTRILSKIVSILFSDKYKSQIIRYKKIYKSYLRKITKDDIVLSTGGDLLCYAENEVIYINHYCKTHKIPSILWGCSVGENNLTPRKLNCLYEFTKIYVRESLTKNVLESHGLKNVYLYPDPAFILKAEKCELPQDISFEKTIGLNLSNFVMGEFSPNSMYGKNLTNLIDYILDNTEYNIILIPHVFWKRQNDETICQYVYNQYVNTNRIKLIDTSKLKYCQIRYLIGKCSLFIGARTHAVISAYSMKIPTLALGYSIKSKGIAKDIGIPDEYVVDCINLKTQDQLTKSFIQFERNKDSLQQILNQNMDKYISKIYRVSEIITDL